MEHANQLKCIFNGYGPILTLVLIMIASGFFGGYLNYLHNFDTSEINENQKVGRNKYILLGIAASFIVPLMLNMIQSNLISYDDSTFKIGNYLIFAGFCLIAAIFSKRFITTIGEKILETAKRAEETAKKNTQKIESTQKELASTNVKIDDVKTTFDLQNISDQSVSSDDGKPLDFLLEIAESYAEKTNIPDYTERVALKGEIGRKMAELILRNNISREDLLADHPSEAMYVAVAYSIQFKPDSQGLDILIKLSKLIKSLFGKAKVLTAYKTLAQNSFITKPQVKEVCDLIVKFRDGADIPLLKNINNTINTLKIIDPGVDLA